MSAEPTAEVANSPSSLARSGSDHEADRLARAALSHVGEPGDQALAIRVAQHGAAVVVDRLRSGHTAGGLAAEFAARLCAVDAERSLADAAARGIRFVVPGDPEWPASLDALQRIEPVVRGFGGSLGLWVRGPLRLDSVAGGVAVVGARNSTSYGEDAAREIGAAVAGVGRTVVSGAAYGIDQSAHRGALSVRGPTVAVLATGVDRPYPAGHDSLVEQIAEGGAVVSEAAPGRPPTKVRFLIRNRIIAALASGTVVVEARIRSGSLNTAHWAERLLRPVMGVPGPVTSDQSAGVLQLLRTSDAIVVTCGADVLEVVSPAGEFIAPVARGETRPHDHLTMAELSVLDAVPAREPAEAPEIARAAGLAVATVRDALPVLVRDGLVDQIEEAYRIRPRRVGP